MLIDWATVAVWLGVAGLGLVVFLLGYVTGRVEALDRDPDGPRRGPT